MFCFYVILFSTWLLWSASSSLSLPGKRCVGLVTLDGVDLSAIEAELEQRQLDVIRGSQLEAAVFERCTVVTVVREGPLEPAALRPFTSWRRELRWIDEDVLSNFAAVGVVEEPDLSARAFAEAIGGGEWFSAFRETARLNPWRWHGPNALYASALERLGARLVEPLLDNCSISHQPTKWLWLHSYGYAPLEPVRGEGLNGWRVVMSRVIALAREVNASVVWPCVRHSVLVPCPVPPGPLVSPDPLSNSADDDFVPPQDKERGVDQAMLRWLELESSDELDDAEADYSDDASRGVRHLELVPATAYFDRRAVEEWLSQPTLSVACAAELLDNLPIRHVRAKGLRSHELQQDHTIYRLSAGFDLSTLRDTVQAHAVETGPLRRFAPRLHQAAERIRQRLAPDGRPLAVMHWRSETLIARRDPGAPSVVQACADALLQSAHTFLEANHSVLLVSDIQADVRRPLWTSFAKKLEKAHTDIPRVLLSFLDKVAMLNIHKLDRLAMNYARLDLGDLAILDQILAVDADTLATHYNSPNHSISRWDGVSFNDCGYAGRFMRTILQRRLSAAKPVLNWYPLAGFPDTKSSAYRRGPQPKAAPVERQLDED